MIYYLAAGVNSMSIFHRKKTVHDPKEAEIQAIREETFRKIEKSNKSTQKLINLLESKTLNVTENIFLATGGERRQKR